MGETIRLQGRDLGEVELALIRELIGAHPDWHRTRISREICERWDWRDQTGRIKDMACRTMLLKLHRRGLIELPAPRHANVNHRRGLSFQPVLHDISALQCSFDALGGVELVIADAGEPRALWQTLLQSYHYLGFNTRVGKSICYLALDAQQRAVGALLFGAAAWKSADRDRFIGWSPKARAHNLERIVNNMRFLIPPWVQVKNLASHILGESLRSLPKHWRAKYGFEPVLAETFVERERFEGTCYKAANWQRVGSTTGRTRQDKNHTIKVPIKEIYLYPLCRDFRTTRCREQR